jgi:hypothetical protein
MSQLSREDLQSLHASAQPPCVSLYLPTHRAGVETQQDPIRFRNLLREAEEQLGHGGFGSRIQDVLGDCRRWSEDFDFWQHQSEGLVVFLAPEVTRRYRLPRSFEELVVVGKRFHFGPLLPLLTGDGRFHVLALSQKRVRLLEATRDSVREMDLHDIPESLQDAVGYDWEERTLQFHSGTARAGVAGGRRPAMFHGQNIGEDRDQEEIQRFLHQVDSGVRRMLREPEEPLVVAGVEYLRAMYRQVSHHPKVLSAGVDGNPDTLSPEELRKRAWPIVEPEFRRSEEAARQSWDRLAGGERVATRLEEVVPASHDGRVDTLFVAVDQHRWGTWDPESRSVDTADSPINGHEDLLDRAALDTLLHGGQVFAVPLGDVPGDGELAAVYRY